MQKKKRLLLLIPKTQVIEGLVCGKLKYQLNIEKTV